MPQHAFREKQATSVGKLARTTPDSQTAADAVSPTGALEPRGAFDAIKPVETPDLPNGGADAVGDQGRAIGPYQIWKSYWSDATDFAKSIGGKYEDVKEKGYEGCPSATAATMTSTAGGGGATITASFSGPPSGFPGPARFPLRPAVRQPAGCAPLAVERGPSAVTSPA